MRIQYILTLWLLSLVLPTWAGTAKTASDFSLPSINSTITLKDYQGKIVYLDFWASWCSPCKDSFPWMNAMQEKYAKDDVVFIAINVDRNKSDAKKFLAQTPANFTLAFDSQGKTPKAYEVMGMPSAYIIDKKGRILHSHIGFNHSDKSSYEGHIIDAIKNHGVQP